MRQAIVDLHRYDRRYRRRIWQHLISGAVGLALVASGVLCIFFGSRKAMNETYQTLYRAVAEAGQQDNTEEMLDAGFAYLEEGALEDLREANPEETAQAFALIGEGYFQREQYKQASDYYEKALGWDVRSDYALRYIVSLARAGSPEEAEEALERYGGQIGGQAATVVSAELACGQGDYRQALELVSGASLAGDSQQAAALCDTGALAAQALQDWGTAANYLEKCWALTGNSAYLQRQAEICYLAAAAATDSESRQTWYEKSLSAYRQLNEAPSALEENRLWEAVLEYKTGDYISARNGLLELAEETEDTAILYRSYMYLAFISYEEQPENRVTVQTYCEYAILYYDQTAASQRMARSSVDIQKLEKLGQQYGCQRTLE